MIYRELNDKEVVWGGPPVVLDVNEDGRNDLLFGIQYVGDPIDKVDIIQFLATGYFYTNFAVSNQETTPCLNKNEIIPSTAFPGYEWYNASAVVLFQKKIPLHGEVQWVGNWSGLRNRYLPFQIITASGTFSGWIEISSVPEDESLIVHRFGLNRKTGTSLQAGK